MPTVEERLRAVEDRLEIIELEGRYARAFDNHDGDAWCALFTPDGVYQPRRMDEPGASFARGTEELRAYCNSAPYRGIHFMHLPQITIDGDVARSRIHLEFYGSFETEGAPFLRMAGYYDVEYARLDGEWKIRRRITSAFVRDNLSVFGYAGEDGFSDPRATLPPA